MLLVDEYINSVDVVFNKIRNPSSGRTKVVASTTRDARRKLPAERHDELLRRAVEISRTDGLGAVTLRKVAADLGVTPGLVSHYFSSAEQLITAAFRTAATEDLEAARALMADQPTPTAKINALMDYTLDESSMDVDTDGPLERQHVVEVAFGGNVEPVNTKTRGYCVVVRRHASRGVVESMPTCIAAGAPSVASPPQDGATPGLAPVVTSIEPSLDGSGFTFQFTDPVPSCRGDSSGTRASRARSPLRGSTLGKPSSYGSPSQQAECEAESLAAFDVLVDGKPASLKLEGDPENGPFPTQYVTELTINGSTAPVDVKSHTYCVAGVRLRYSANQVARSEWKCTGPGGPSSTP